MKERGMEELEKLKKLLHHWKEHNDGHAESYRIWSEKASAQGEEELSKVLGRLYSETKGLDGLFDEATGLINL